MTSEAGDEREVQLEVARRIALDLLTVRQRSEHELRTAMARRNVPEAVMDEVLARFGEVGLVDDEAFARSLTASRSGFGHRGRARIRQELQLKGIERGIAEEALAALDPDDERAAALELARRKVGPLQRLERHVARRRLGGVLSRRGFSAEIVNSVLGEILDDPSVEFSTGPQ